MSLPRATTPRRLPARTGGPAPIEGRGGVGGGGSRNKVEPGGGRIPRRERSQVGCGACRCKSADDADCGCKGEDASTGGGFWTVRAQERDGRGG